MLDVEFQDAAAWRGADLGANAGRFQLPAAALG